MRALALALLMALTVIAVAPGMEAAAHPCNQDPPVESRKCPYRGSELWACNKKITNFCVWGP